MNVSQIQRTYILNLAHRTDRRESALAELAKIGIHDPVVFQGLRPQDISIPLEELQKPLHKINRFTPGSYAYTQGFLKILADAQASQVQNFLYVDDDVNFENQHEKSISTVLMELPKDWDILHLGTYHWARPEIFSEHLVKAKGTWIMNAALFNAQGYDKIYKLISEGFRPADLSIGMAYYLGADLKIFAVKDNMAFEKISYSDIAGKIDEKNLPKNVFEHVEILPIEIAYAQNPNLDLEQIWRDIESKSTT